MAQEKKTISEGEELLTAMFRLLQVVKIHQANNKLFMDNIESFRAALKRLWAKGRPAEFALYRGRFYLNDERIIYSAAMWNTVIKISEFFQERDINGLKLFPNEEVSDTTIVRLMDVLNRSKREKEPYQWLAENLIEDLAWAQVTQEKDHDSVLMASGEGGGDGPQGRQALTRTNLSPELVNQAKRAYSQALTVTRNIYSRLGEKKKIGVQKAKRAIQELIDILFEDEIVFLALSTIRDGTDALFTHSVNTAILAIGVGHRLRLSRAALEQLGLASLFHDIGMAGAPLRVANIPGRLEGKDRALAQSHVLASLYHIVRLNATFTLKLAMLNPTNEHHQGLDGSGYPRNDNPQAISLFGRILAIADQYVAMTSARPWRSEMSPFEALMVLLDKSANQLDHLLVKVFINFVGPWPVGSLLALSSRELALAKHTPPDSEEGWPLAQLLLLGEGETPTLGEVIDLGEKDASGELKRRVVNCFHPSHYGVQPVDFLLGL
ncbi:MAG: HD domain-containing protein [Deltaproteobacteria bacterium]|jgi:HD-GYP domain-containing protein (c-di-GMP phosphodiesterase class II)|nr:HD domain-containing protein [Deltaproteobacteria bacterium]